MEMIELAERCEEATGPDRDIDGWIWAHIKRGERYIIGNKPGRFPQAPIYGERADVMRDIGGSDGAEYIGAPLYTASIDAALTLLPEGADWRRLTHQSISVYAANPYNANAQKRIDGMGATPALAMTAAALRIRAASVGRNPEGRDAEERLGAQHEHAVPKADAQPLDISEQPQ